ncbi:NAD-dependent epimerase/dehydratase family protein [Myxococcota bacterium]|nr:NAD-dependent epimerase/dehydratase family protein [Myxococcota bacterium]MBU1535085.1 NAD-dependent epimerase/dehydratase family protein [Myxococcota bacterium]
MTTIDKNKPVMITGATGYVAGWIVKKLLDEGLTVHAPVRDPKNKSKTKYLDELAASAPGKIVYFAADLLTPGSYDAAMEGCELVFHTASPFINKVRDPQKDLVDPALKGTQNVLASVNSTQSVKRVVLTSSCAAIIGDNKDILGYDNQKATEKNWNETSTLTHNPYSYSKTVAEKEAWKIAEGQSRWDLVVINPALVIGPGINPNATSESFTIVKQLGDGSARMGAPNLEIGMVDVRDLAEAHYAAGFTPEAQGRHIIQAGSHTFLSLGLMLREKYANAYPFPKRTLPKFLVWLMAPTVGITRKFVSNSLGYQWKVDNSKGIHGLNLTYRPVKTSIVDMFEQMIQNGTFKK